MASRFARTAPTISPDTPGGQASPFLAARAPLVKVTLDMAGASSMLCRISVASHTSCGISWNECAEMIRAPICIAK